MQKINLSNFKTLYFDGKKQKIDLILQRKIPQNEWLPAEVPGCNYLDMLRAEKIENPFYGENFKKAEWIEKHSWWYQTEFTLQNEIIKNKNVMLNFEGLDTFCHIYLNQEKIAETKNMFIPYQFDITSKVLSGKNILDVHILSPLSAMQIEGISTTQALLHSIRAFISGLRGIKTIGWKEFVKSIKDQENFEKLLKKEKNKNFFDFVKNFSQWFTLRAFARKSQVSYGWDICVPRFLQSGIYRPAYLKICDEAVLKNIWVKTNTIRQDKAEITLYGEIECFSNKLLDVKLKITIKDPTGKVEIDQLKSMKIKNSSFSFDLEISFPKLWFPHTAGEPHLYQYEISLINGRFANRSYNLDKKSGRFGIRKIELIKKDEQGNCFVFEINGKKIFSKGANWVPLDAFFSRVKDEKYIEVLKMAKEANMNMVRVWGGGIIEKDIFYNLCDEMGIMIWQDFMFACGFYPDDKKFLNIAQEEGEEIVKKLRGHPSIVLWCGDNENDMICHEKGHPLNRKILPFVCKKFDGTRPYHSSSPSGGKHPNDEKEGDRHNWTVWHGQKSYKTFADDLSCFVSEFGLIAWPKEKILKKFIPQENLHLTSDVFPWHSSVPFKEETMLKEYGEADNVKDYAFLTQVAQGEGIKWALEHYRRRKYRCGGALIWQLSDLLPGMTWSIIDYYLYPKISYYFTKKCFAPLLVSFKEEKENISLWVVSDKYEKIKGEVKMFRQSFSGEIFWSEEFKVNIEPDTSREIFNKISRDGKGNEFLYADLRVAGELISENYYFFSLFKEQEKVKANIHISFYKIKQNTAVVKIKSDKLARYVEVESEDNLKYSDNYFNVLPRVEKEVIIENISSKEIFLKISGYNTNRIELKLKK